MPDPKNSPGTSNRRSGDMVVIGPDGRLAPSDQILIGATGRATGNPAVDGVVPEKNDTDFTSGGHNPGSDGENYGTYDN